MTRFSAHVQYDDWRGTAAADDADAGAMRAFLKQKGLLADDEFLIGFEFYSGQNHFAARAFVIEAGNYEGAVKEITAKDPIPTRIRELELTSDQFFALFKRFNVVMTQTTLELDGRNYRDREI